MCISHLGYICKIRRLTHSMSMPKWKLSSDYCTERPTNTNLFKSISDRSPSSFFFAFSSSFICHGTCVPRKMIIPPVSRLSRKTRHPCADASSLWRFPRKKNRLDLYDVNCAALVSQPELNRDYVQFNLAHTNRTSR